MYRILFHFAILFTTISAQSNIESLLNNGKYTEVIDSLSLKLEADSTNFKYNFLLGKAYSNLFKFQQAVKYFETASKIDSLNKSPFVEAANCYSNLGMTKHAIINLRRAFFLDSTNTSIGMNLSILLMEYNDYKAALEILKQMSVLDSENPFIHKQLGICYLKLGDSKNSIDSFLASHKLNELDITPIIYISQFYRSYNDHVNAELFVDKGLAINKTNMRLNKLKAEISFMKKEYNLTVLHSLNAIVYGDSTNSNYKMLGLSYYFLAEKANPFSKQMNDFNYNKAIEAFQSAIHIDSSDGFSNMYIGICYRDKGAMDSAVVYFQRALDIMLPSVIGDVYSYLGNSYSDLKDYENAIKAFKSVFIYKPENPVTYYFLATVCDKFYKDKSIAYKYFKSFLNSGYDTDTKILEYAKSRIDKLDEEMGSPKKTRDKSLN